MIKYKKGDLLKSGCHFICHQVNCQGVMGSGLALAIKNKFPRVYTEYKGFCAEAKKSSDLLGSNQYVLVGPKTIVVNMFAQDNYGLDKRHTDYESLRCCLKMLSVLNVPEKFDEKDIQVRIGIPYKLGCARGGGDWNIVITIIEEYFKNSPFILEIWEL